MKDIPSLCRSCTVSSIGLSFKAPKFAIYRPAIKRSLKHMRHLHKTHQSYPGGAEPLQRSAGRTVIWLAGGGVRENVRNDGKALRIARSGHKDIGLGGFRPRPLYSKIFAAPQRGQGYTVQPLQLMSVGQSTAGFAGLFRRASSTTYNPWSLGAVWR